MPQVQLAPMRSRLPPMPPSHGAPTPQVVSEGFSPVSRCCVFRSHRFGQRTQHRSLDHVCLMTRRFPHANRLCEL
jgi:hypothetical protein